MIIQSVLFSINFFTIPECIKWLRLHNLHYNKVDITKNYYRWRQINPLQLKHEGYSHYFTKPINNGKILLIEAYL